MSDCSFTKCRSDFRLILALVLMTAAAIAFLGQVETRQHAANLQNAEQILPVTAPAEQDGPVSYPHPL